MVYYFPSDPKTRNAVMTDMFFCLLCRYPRASWGYHCVWLTSERRDWLAGRYVSCNWDMAELLHRQDEIVEKDLLKLKLAL